MSGQRVGAWWPGSLGTGWGSISQNMPTTGSRVGRTVSEGVTRLSGDGRLVGWVIPGRAGTLTLGMPLGDAKPLSPPCGPPGPMDPRSWAWGVCSGTRPLGGGRTGVPASRPASGSAPSSSCPMLPGIRVFSNKWALHISPEALPEFCHPGPPGPGPPGCSRAGELSPRGRPGTASTAPGLGARAGQLSPPPAPRGPAPCRWSPCARGPPGPRTGRCHSRSSGCGRASHYPTPRRSPSLTCPRKRRSPGGSPGRTHSVWKVDGGHGWLVTVRPGTPASGHTPSTPTGALLPAGRLTPPCA